VINSFQQPSRAFRRQRDRPCRFAISYKLRPAFEVKLLGLQVVNVGTRARTLRMVVFHRALKKRKADGAPTGLKNKKRRSRDDHSRRGFL